MGRNTNLIDHSLPVPGTVYAIPADTHADLDLQDDKEQMFYSRRSFQNGFMRFSRRR